MRMQIPKPSQARLVAYLPGLDGLRAIAVIAVVLYHADCDWIPGGYLGVEVFFVISGYLITSLLFAEMQSNNGYLDLKGFWVRRARRLLPALILLIAVVVPYAVLFLPEEVAGLRGDVIGALTYVSNWYYIFREQSYFEAAGRPPLLQHLWSLAVEEQFYLLWPLFFSIGMRKLSRRALLCIMVLGAILSAALMVLWYTPAQDSSRLYFGTDTRAAGLLIGAILAFVSTPGAGRRTPGLLDPLGLIALVGLACQMVTMNEYEPFLYQGGLTVVALTTAIVIAAAAQPSSRVARMLGARLLCWVGVRSYGIYLWHWPIFMVTRPQLDVPFESLGLFALRIGLTCAIAELSYRFVEKPIRNGGLGRWFADPRAAPARAGRLGLAAILTVPPTFALGVALANAPPPAAPEFSALSRTPEVMAAYDSTMVSADRPVPAARTRAQTDQGSQRSLVARSSTEEAPESMRETTFAEVSIASPQKPPIVAQAPSPKARRLLAVGDSVMLGAANALRSLLGPGIIVDAAVGRQVSDAISILRAHTAAGQLRDLVVIQLGNNGTFTTKQFDEIMQIIGPSRPVVFLTVKVPRRWEALVNKTLESSVPNHKNAKLIDWRKASKPRPELFGKDGIHLRPEGQQVYAQLIDAHLPDP